MRLSDLMVCKSCSGLEITPAKQATSHLACLLGCRQVVAGLSACIHCNQSHDFSVTHHTYAEGLVGCMLCLCCCFCDCCRESSHLRARYAVVLSVPWQISIQLSPATEPGTEDLAKQCESAAHTPEVWHAMCCAAQQQQPKKADCCMQVALLDTAAKLNNTLATYFAVVPIGPTLPSRTSCGGLRMSSHT